MNNYPLKAVENKHGNNCIPFGRDKYQAIVENSSFYLLTTDLRGKYTYLNRFFCRHFNVDPVRYVNSSFLALITPQDHQIYRDTVQRCVTETGHSINVTLGITHGKEVIFTRWELRAVLSETDGSTEILCIGHDINWSVWQQELKVLAQVTAEQNEKLVNFTYVISHNIRSHVANITGILKLSDACNELEREICWGMIRKCASSLEETIRNLNEIVSIQATTSLPVKKNYIRDEFDRIIDSIKLIFDRSRVQITYHFDRSFFLETNPAYLESIILNLLTNAIKYRSAHRPLQIDLSFNIQDDYRVLIFKDNGVGINLDLHREQMFGMYKTFHGNADAKGLGLFITKTQIEALGGKIEVESVVDEFTIFKIYFKDCQ